MKRIIFLWRVLLGSGIIVLGLFVLNYHLPLSGEKRIVYDFRAPNGIISHAYPVARVRDMAFTDGRSYRPMIEEPVYVDVKTIVPYRAARIELVYQNATEIPLQLGMKQTRDDATFVLKSFENEIQEGEWLRGSVPFDLSAASYYNGKYTFAFSVPGLRAENSSGGEARLSRMTLSLERTPLLWSDIAMLWKKF